MYTYLLYLIVVEGLKCVCEFMSSTWNPDRVPTQKLLKPLKPLKTTKYLIQLEFNLAFQQASLFTKFKPSLTVGSICNL